MRAKKINEFGGAGFSYGGASMASARPGGINRGGFSSANGFGGPNSMYTYEIKPLNRTLQPEANDTEGEERISKGNDISGAELNAKDDILHVGPVMNVVTSDDGSLMYYVILDPDTARQMKIDPTTARLVSKMDGVDPLGVKLTPEEESLVNPGEKSVASMGSKNESYQTKFVKESLNEE